jgi:hypothetical protein
VVECGGCRSGSNYCHHRFAFGSVITDMRVDDRTLRIFPNCHFLPPYFFSPLFVSGILDVLRVSSAANGFAILSIEDELFMP